MSCEDHNDYCNCIVETLLLRILEMLEEILEVAKKGTGLKL